VLGLPKLDEHNSFHHQLEGTFYLSDLASHVETDSAAEVEKAIDNLVKSGKLYSGVSSGSIVAPVPQVAVSTRRDSVPATMGAMPRSPLDTSSDLRMTQTIPSRHYSVHSIDNVRPSQSYANLHSYYASQRAGQRTPEDDIQLLQLKRRAALQQQQQQQQRDGKQLPSEYSSTATSNTGSASSSLILDTSLSATDPVHSPLALSDVVDDPYAARRRRFRLGSASFDGLVGISEADLTPRAGPQTAGVIGSGSISAARTSPTTTFDLFATEFGAAQAQPSSRDHDRRLREQRSRGESNNAESPSPRSATFSLFSSESTQTNTNTTASSPESSPLKTTKPSLPPASKIAPIGTKRSSGSLNSDNSERLAPQTTTVAPSQNTLPLPSPHITSPSAENDKWSVFSGGWGTPFVNGSDTYHTRAATTDSNSQKGIWGSNPKGLGMTVGGGSVDVWG
jgi:hypothetical protein